MGDSSGEYESGTKWFFDVGYDENRLLVKRRFYSRAEHVQPWMDFYFEVKDHGHTLYHKRKWGKDVAVFEKDLYFRPVGKQKNRIGITPRKSLLLLGIHPGKIYDFGALFDQVL